MKRPSWAIPIALLCVFAVGTGACSDDDEAADVPILKFQGFPADPVGLPALVMAEEGIDVENGFHAEYLAVDPDAATSPTFTLIHEYEGKRPLVHVDLYRLEHPDDIAGLGLEEYFEGPGVVAVEWAERAGALMPAGAVEVRFQRLGPERRRVTITEGGSAPD